MSISSDPFFNLPNLTNLVFSNTFVSNVSDIRGALESIRGKENVSITLHSVGIGDDHVSKLFGKSISNKTVILKLNDNELQTLPLDIFQTWPQLHTIECNENKIAKITFGRLPTLRNLFLNSNRLTKNSSWQFLEDNLPNLTNLSLGGNGIATLEVIDWQRLPSLKSLNLSDNQIEYLNYSTLQRFKQVDFLDLSRNWLSSRTFIKKDTPKNTLKSINLARNKFSPFSPWFCMDNETAIFQELQYLDLSYNLFQYPQAQAWNCLHKLKVLNLRSNPIVKLTNNTFTNLTNLEELILSDNRNGGMTAVEPAAFNNTHLEGLDLRWNNLRFFRNPDMLEIFKYTPNLKHLKLSDNNVGQLNQSDMTYMLSPLRNLESLYLKQCKLHGIPDGLLGNFKNLTTLYMDRNYLDSTKLPALLRNVVNLQTLVISENYIRFIEINSFPLDVQRSIKILDLSNNPFDCSCDNRWFLYLLHRNNSSVFGQPLIGWPNKYICRTPAKYSRTLLKDVSLDCDHISSTTIIFITIGSCLFVFAIVTGVLYRFRWYFIYWRYKWLREREGNEESDVENQLLLRRAYDVCCIYSLKDDSVGAFLRNEFIPLMDTLGYEAFIWDRNAGVGPRVSECADSIYGSRSTVAVITNSFLKDPFSKFQLEIALDREMELNRDFLTIFVLEEVDYKRLSKYWCVRFTKIPTMQWCSDRGDIRRKTLEQFIRKRFGEPARPERESVIYRRTET